MPGAPGQCHGEVDGNDAEIESAQRDLRRDASDRPTARDSTLDRNRERLLAIRPFVADLSVRRVLTDITVSNGMAWSPDASTFYFIDSPTRKIRAFDYERATGEISNERVAVEVPKSMGAPDGMTIDENGNLWVALWGGRKVACWDPGSARLEATIDVRADQVSSCAFGGPNLDELYITTAREGLDEDRLRTQPLAGGLFRAKPGPRGLPTRCFAG